MRSISPVVLLAAFAVAAPSESTREGVQCLEYHRKPGGGRGHCRIWQDAAYPKDDVDEVEDAELAKVCKNGPNNRQCWSPGFDINTDFDTNWPDTGVTRQYSFDITNGTAAPDGIPRDTFLINGQYMGPTIYADWGDYVEVTVTNYLQDNGTGIHWHGVRQWHSNYEDGVPGVTECPLAPGQSKVYRWQATQYGTSW